jgi:hypothetical protein
LFGFGLLVFGTRRPLNTYLTTFIRDAFDCNQGFLCFAVRAEVNKRVLIPHDCAFKHIAILIEQFAHFLLVHVFGKICYVQFGAALNLSRFIDVGRLLIVKQFIVMMIVVVMVKM